MPNVSPTHNEQFSAQLCSRRWKSNRFSDTQDYSASDFAFLKTVKSVVDIFQRPLLHDHFYGDLSGNV